MTLSKPSKVRQLANQMVVGSFTLMSLLLVLLLASIARPIYLSHGSSIMTRDGMRLAVNDGVFDCRTGFHIGHLVDGERRSHHSIDESNLGISRTGFISRCRPC